MKKIYVIAFALVLASALIVHAADNLKAFPPPEKGMVRYVLQLPKQKVESAYKVELIVGKSVLVDRNRYFFSGQITKETIKGWGFSRYTVSDLGPMAGTLMAADPNIPKTERFIALGGKPYLIRYNSRLPVVVYVPKGVEVHYRLWSAGKTQMMQKG